MRHPTWLAIAGLLLICVGVGRAPAQTYVDESLTAHELLDQTAALRAQDRVADAIEMLGRILIEYPDKLLPLGDDIFTDTRLRVRDMILGDPALLEGYRQRNAASAQRALGLALGSATDEAALQTVLRDYGLTRSGLEAALALAGVYLERGDGAGARSVLDEVATHPDLASRVKDYHHASAVAEALLGNRDAFDVARLAFVQAGGDDLAWLDQLAEAVFAQPQAQAPQTLINSDRALWSYRFTSPPNEEDANTARAGVLRAQTAGQAMNALQAGYGTLPTPAGRLVLVNQGNALHAVDAESGRPIWQYHLPAPQVGGNRAAQQAMLMRMNRMVVDARGVGVEGRRAFAVLGTPMGTQFQQLSGSTDSVLVCLNLDDGSEAWSLTISDLDQTKLDGGRFVGTPTLAFGRVFIPISKQVAGSSIETFVVCIDAESGKPRWLRHLSNQTRRLVGIQAPAAQILIDGNHLLISDAMNVVASMDARTGLVRWLNVIDTGDLPAGRDNRAMVIRQGGPADLNMSPLVKIEAGLLVSISAQNRSAALLDPRTGQTRRTVSGWSNGAQMIPVDDDVLVVGEQTMRLSGRDLSERWKSNIGGGNNRIVGSAAVIGDQLAIPTVAGIRILHAEDGKDQRTIASIKGGHIVARHGALLVADADYLHAVDEWPSARQRIVERAQAAPDDPDAGMSLAYLALNQHDDQAVLEGVDLAIFALDRAAPAAASDRLDQQRRVFQQVLAFTDLSAGASDKLRAALFDRIASLTDGPADEVAYHLAYGAFLSEPTIARADVAVSHYQSILASPDLASEVFERDGYRRQAGLEAQRRVHALVRERGPGIYRRFDELAMAEYQQLYNANGDARQFIQLAQGYPLSSAASLAHLRAATLLAEDNDTAGAATQYRLAYEQARDHAQRANAAASLAEHYQRTGQLRRAQRWLERVAHDIPGVQLPRGGSIIAIDTWIAELAASPEPATVMPGVHPHLAQAKRIPGSIVPAAPGSIGFDSAGDRFLTIEDNTLHFYARPDQPPLWAVASPFDDPITLGVSSEQVLLFSPARGELVAINGRSGRPDWPARHAASVLREVSEDDRLAEDRNRVDPEILQMLSPGNTGRRVQADTRRQDRAPSNLIIRASESVVVIADNLGRVVGLDRHTGSILWRLQAPIDQLSQVTLGVDAIALAGNSFSADSAHAGRLLVIDLITGQPRIPTIHLGAALPRWAAFAGSQKLILIDLAGVVAYDLNTAQVVWRSSISSVPLTGDAWAGHDTLIVPDSDGVAHIVDADTGRTHRRVSAEARRRSPPSDAQLLDDASLILAPGSLISLTPAGHVAWRDAIEPDQRNFARQFVGRTHVAVLSQTTPRPTDNDRAPTWHLFIFDRATGKVAAQHTLPALRTIDPANSLLIDRALLLNIDGGILALPMTEAE